MKILDLSLITGATGMPVKKGTLLHLQQSYKEIIEGLIKGVIPFNIGDVVILYGCEILGTNPGSISNSAGAVFYNGEVYLVDAQTFTTTGANIPAWTIVEISVSTLGYDTVKLTNGADVSVHKDRKFKLVNSPIGGSGIVGYVADFNSANVRQLNGLWTAGGYTSIASLGATNTTVVNYFEKKQFQKTMFVNAKFTITYNAGGTNDQITIINPVGLRAFVPIAAPVGLFTVKKSISPFTSSVGSVFQSGVNANHLELDAVIGTVVSGDVYIYTLCLQYPCYSI